jgi:CBS domain-containing protein
MEFARDVMTTPLDMVHENTNLFQTAQKMKDKNIGFLAIGDGSEITGCVTDRDLVVEGMARGYDPRQHVVSEVMTRNPLTCGKDSKVEQVINLMKEHKIYRVIVTDNNKDPVGVISFGDLVNRTSEETPVESALREINRKAQ